MRLVPMGSVRLVRFVLLLVLSLIAVAVGGVSSGTTTSKSQIKIHESGTDNRVQSGTQGSVRGKFTIDLKGTPFGPGGTTVIYAVPGQTKYVNGQAQIPLAATDHLTSKTGTIELAITGTHIDLNTKLTSSGHSVGPAAEHGTWKIRTATGIYEGWKGGGSWASVAYGYGAVQPYSVEWDGYVTG